APWNASEITFANRATMAAPTIPPRMPILIQRPRPATPRVAAMTMPTIRPASITSRNTMIAAPSMPLFRDHHALGGGLIELAEERIAARGQRADTHHTLRFAGNHFLDLHFMTFEFFRRWVIIDDCNLHPFVGWHFDLSRRELMVLDRDGHVLGTQGRRREDNCRDGTD